MISAVADLARRLARDAEAVCRYYLSKGRRSGRYWGRPNSRVTKCHLKAMLLNTRDNSSVAPD